MPMAMGSPRHRGDAELGPQALDGIDLHHDHALEVASGPQVEVGVRRAGEAVRAGMAAAAVGVDREGEGHPARSRHPVDDGAAVHVEELEAAVLATADVTADDLVREQPGLLGLFLSQAPTQPSLHATSLARPIEHLFAERGAPIRHRFVAGADSVAIRCRAPG